MTSHPLLNRTIDVAISLAALPVAIPLCMALMLVVRMESRGSPLFVQDRLGRDEIPFRMLKLRTMAANTRDLPSHHVGADRITRVGRVLRRLKFDELPQLLNVITGAMSLVGPRPCLPSQEEVIEARRAKGLFAVRPGITGPAQLLGLDMSEPARLADAEAEYFRDATPIGNLALIVKTAIGRGAGDPALKSGGR